MNTTKAELPPAQATELRASDALTSLSSTDPEDASLEETDGLMLGGDDDSLGDLDPVLGLGGDLEHC